MSKPRKKKRSPKRVLALPDLEQSKAAVLNTLTSKSGQRRNEGHELKTISTARHLTVSQVWI
jgi:hypothetical protein